MSNLTFEIARFVTTNAEFVLVVFFLKSKLIVFLLYIYMFLCQVDRHSHWHEKYFFPAEPTEGRSSASLTPFIDKSLKCSKSDTMQDICVQISKNKTKRRLYDLNIKERNRWDHFSRLKRYKKAEEIFYWHFDNV